VKLLYQKEEQVMKIIKNRLVYLVLSALLILEGGPMAVIAADIQTDKISEIAIHKSTEDDVSGGDVSGGDVSGGDVSGGDVSGGDVSGNDVCEIFDDVEEGTWEADAIQYVYDKKLMVGKGDGIFDPIGNITRAEFVTTLYSMTGKPEVTYSDAFSDVEDGLWYTNPIIWACENNITTGYANGKFGVSDSITREQMALMLYKYATDVLGFEDNDNTQEGILDVFTDTDRISWWAEEAMEWAVANGVIAGTGDSKLNAPEYASRAECAAILRTFCKNFDVY